jgi:hypothetical protein
MAHVSGAVMLAYVTMGAPLKYLITASVMAAPGTFMIAKILWPETETPVTMGEVKMKVEKTSANFIDAAATGASQGMTLCLNISAMLIASGPDALNGFRLGGPGWLPDFRSTLALAYGAAGMAARRAKGRYRFVKSHREQDGHQRVLRVLNDEGRRASFPRSVS